MIKVKQLYHIYDDGDGHRYLIPKEEENTFYGFLDDLWDILSETLTGSALDDLYEDQKADYLEQYNRLEGEAYYVVLAEDLGE